MSNQIDKKLQKENSFWIVNGICQKEEKVICNLGYTCDTCPYAQDVGGWQGCNSKSNTMCLSRRCLYADVLYLIDESTPEVKCTRPAGKLWESSLKTKPPFTSMKDYREATW